MRSMFSTWKKMAGIPVAAGLLALATIPASADNLTINDVEFSDGYQYVNITAPISDPNQLTGEVNLSGHDNTTNTSWSHDVWCVDIYHNVFLGGGQNLSYSTQQYLSTDNNGHALTTSQINAMSYLIIWGSMQMSGAHNGDSIYSAAIQTALWKLEFSGFSFTASAQITSLVNTLVAAAAFWAANGSNCSATTLCDWDAHVYQVLGLNTQSFAGYWDGQGQIPGIPEPASLALFGTGLLGFAGLYRRRKKVATKT